MKTIKINQLEIVNFKGIQYLQLELNGKDATLYGDNATGKSSVYDALTWLLFGKDSHGNTKFAIKPLDPGGNTSAGVMPTVSAILDINGQTVSLKKQLRERWEKHRGGQERYAGNTVDHYIDDVPMKENQYKTYISEIVSEDVFRALTGIYRFCRDVGWKQRREILFNLACVESDSQLLKAPQFAPLSKELGGRTVEQYREVLKKWRKDANTMMNQYPARIDECEKQLVNLPESFDTDQRDLLETEIGTLRGQLAALDNSEARNAKRNEIRETELELQALETENRQFRLSQDIPIVDERSSIRQDIARLEGAIRQTESQALKCRQAIEDADKRLEDYRQRWKAENAVQYTGGVCPTCGQALPTAMEAAARKWFEEEKTRKKNSLVADSNFIKQHKEKEQQSYDELNQSLEAMKSEMNDLNGKLKTAAIPEKPIIEDLPDYAARCTDLTTRITRLRSELDNWNTSIETERSRLYAKIKEAEKSKSEQDDIASKVQLRQSLEKRITEIQQERRAKAAYIENIDSLLDMCDDFTQYKVDRVSTAVNSRFDIVSFRLFTEAINGSLQDCCDAIVNGVPYSDLNSAMQVNAGLDCIRTLSDFYGVSVPLFVDNAESVTKLYTIDAQVIRLVVSENDKKLRCEV